MSLRSWAWRSFLTSTFLFLIQIIQKKAKKEGKEKRNKKRTDSDRELLKIYLTEVGESSRT